MKKKQQTSSRSKPDPFKDEDIARSKQKRVRQWEHQKSFIRGIHDHRWQDGVPPVLLAEYAAMERQTPQYADLR